MKETDTKEVATTCRGLHTLQNFAGFKVLRLYSFVIMGKLSIVALAVVVILTLAFTSDGYGYYRTR